MPDVVQTVTVGGAQGAEHGGGVMHHGPGGGVRQLPGVVTVGGLGLQPALVFCLGAFLGAGIINI